MPIINAGYKFLETKKKKIAAVSVVVFITTFTHAVNCIPITAGGIGNIGMVPNYFNSGWPIAYYMVGLYIGEYKPRINKSLCVGLIALVLTSQATLNYFTATDIFYSGIIFNNEDVVTLLTATLIFLLFYDIQIENKIVRKIFSWLSSLSMTFYLVSYIGDSYFYSKMFAGQFN